MEIIPDYFNVNGICANTQPSDYIKRLQPRSGKYVFNNITFYSIKQIIKRFTTHQKLFLQIQSMFLPTVHFALKKTEITD